MTFFISNGNFLLAGSIIAAYLLLESLFPLFPHRVAALPRWLVNGSLYIINGIVTYFLLFYLFGFSIEAGVTAFEFGLFYWVQGVPFWLQCVTFFICADLGFYWLHRAMHQWQPLWRVHIVHHSDVDVDITDSFRGHPLQIMLEIALRLAVTLALGVPLLVLITYDVLYKFFVFFPHANLRMPRQLDRVLRLLVVTPDMHRIHHSARSAETNSNYSDIFSFWDRIFGTYRFMDPEEQKKMPLGLEYFREPRDRGLVAVLMQPFNYTPDHSQPVPEELQPVS